MGFSQQAHPWSKQTVDDYAVKMNCVVFVIKILMYSVEYGDITDLR